MRKDPNSPESSESPGQPVDYVEAANRAIDHVVQGLDRPLRLEDVAQVAGFSPFHFHRIFKAMVGETLHQFVRRLRLERALFLMTHDPKRSLTDIALACGFSSSSDFSRSFKQRYGTPPSAFDVEGFRESNRESLYRQMESGGLVVDRERLTRSRTSPENPDGFEVELVSLPPRTVAYIRVLDPYQGTGVVDAATRLVAWAEERGLADGQWLGYMWEDPELVALEDCRYDVGLEVPAAALEAEPQGIGRSGRGEARGEIGRVDLPAMLVAEVEMRGPIDLEMRLLEWLFGNWLPRSGFVPEEAPCFEAWIGRPFAHGVEHFELKIQLPLRRG